MVHEWLMLEVIAQPCSLADAVFRYDPSTRDSISSDPLLPDPYELTRVEARPSKVAGEGLFAKRFIAAGVRTELYCIVDLFEHRK